MFFIIILLMFSFDAKQVNAYGGGSGGGGGGESSGASELGSTTKSDIKRVYTRSELERFFSGLPPSVREMIIDKQEGKERSLAQLHLIRTIFLQAERFKGESEASYWQSYEDLAVLLDKTGQNAELVLAFTTGGSSTFITQTLFGAVRAGANEYSKDKSVGDIIQAIAVSVAVDKIMATKNLSRIGNRANNLVDMVYRANKLKKNPRVLKYLAKVGAKAGIYKQGESYTKAQIANILNFIANQAKKLEPTNTTPSPNIYRNQAGFW